MRRLLIGLSLLLSSAAFGQGVSTVGGLTVEVCSSPAVITTAYTTGNVVGGLISLVPTFRGTGSGAPDAGGITQSVRINLKDVQTATFKAYEFTSLPTTTFTDNGTASLSTADKLKVLGPIALSSPDSGLGTHTVYQTDAIARAHVASGATDYWVVVVTGTPTFASASNFQFCAAYLVD